MAAAHPFSNGEAESLVKSDQDPPPPAPTTAPPPTTAPSQKMEDGNTNDDHAGEPVRVSEQSSTQKLDVPDGNKLEVPAPASDAGSRRGSHDFDEDGQPKPKMRTSIFKAQLDSNINEIDKAKYDVTDFYHEDGLVVFISKHSRFENSTFLVIGLNAIWLMIDSDNNSQPTLVTAHPFFQIGESFFAIYFTAEVIIRFLSFKRKRDCIKDGWFNFDSCLVTLMVVETWCLPIVLGDEPLPFDVQFLRLLRLLRLARMVRLLRGLPELLTLVKAMGAAVQAVSTVFGLLLLILYVFAIVFKMQLGDPVYGLTDYFGSVPGAMICLFYSGTLGDNITQVFEDIKAQKWSMAGLYLVYVFLTMFTVLNMLIGVLCEVVSAVDAKSKEDILIDYVRETLLKTLTKIDEESDGGGDGMISRTEFDKLMADDDAKSALIELDVDPDMFGAVSAYLFDPAEPDGPEKELGFAEFLQRVLKMRSKEQARVLDIMEMQKHIQKEHAKTASEIAKAKEDILKDISGTSDTRLQTVEASLEAKIEDKLSLIYEKLDILAKRNF
jgi:voltage-gated sodium channel